MDDDELQRIYTWVDEVPLSRPKRNIARDFADGVLTAEIVHHYFPRIVEVHNYPSANSYAQKMYNWNTLNQKVFRKMGFQVSKSDLEGVCNCAPGVVERVLRNLHNQIEKIQEVGSLPVPKSRGPKQRSPPAVKSAEPVTVAPPAGRREKPAAAPHHPEQRGGNRGVSNRHLPNEKEDPYAPPTKVQGRPPAVPSQPQSHYQPARMSTDDLPAVAPVAAYHVPQRDVDTEILVEKEQTIQELRETVDILETKIRKLEQLVKLKDTKISSLQSKLNIAQSSGMH